MFTNIFFLILLMLLIGFIPEVEYQPWTANTFNALSIGIIAYIVLLFVIFIQNRISKNFTRRHLPRMLFLTNVELLAFLCFFNFILTAHQSFPQYQTLISLVSIAFYFVGIAVHHLSTYSAQNHAIRNEYSSPLSFTWMQLGFLMPIVIPFILLTLVMDLSSFIPNNSEWGTLTLIIISVTTIFALLIFFPLVLQFFWRCTPIKDLTLRNRLENFCKKLQFTHAGIKTWSVMRHALTAGIIGLVPRYRYVIFTDRILHELSPECLEAILAHEIAHSKLKHLIFYPFIIMGMSVLGGLIFFLLGDAISSPIMAFLIYTTIAVVYFRLIFGYFSRLFERQADLYVFTAGVPHHYMLQALDFIGVATGNSHHIPSWHHYGIQERIDFLCDAAIDRELITQHNKWVKWSLIGYFTILILSIIFLFGVI